MSFHATQVPVTETSLDCYFKDRLSHYAQRLRPAPHEDTCWYLGSLLVRFTRSEEFFTYDQGQLTLRPLALIYGDALQTSNPRHRCLLLQHLGDMSLVLGALFPQHYARRGIQRDYFIGMGGSAYDYLAENAHHGRHIFAELARTFTHMLALVARACSRSDPVTHDDILALYQRWRDSGDRLAERQLQAVGIELSGKGLVH